MNLTNRIMSYDKTKIKNQENCNCEECVSVETPKSENQTVEYPKLSEEEIEWIISERYSDKDGKTKTFIRKALRKHGDRYNYSNVVYTKSDVDVEIICRVKGHEPFLQKPNKHLYGQGCRVCGIEKQANKQRITKEEFIEKANEIHGFGRYDYSKVEYVNNYTEVIIICNNHDEPYEFPQTPSNHLIGKGCSICGIKKCAENRKSSKGSKFIERARKIHKNKYDYSKVNYIKATIEVIITCPKHGDFPQTPNKHLSGRGCRECQYEKVSEIHKLSTEEFIRRAKEIHGDKYDYSKVNYIGYEDEVIIICPKHGDFPQTPAVHLSGSGCQICCESKGEISVRNFLTKHNIEFEEQKRFKDCKDKQTLPFDFYVPKYKLCIEFDGLQHFKKIKWNKNMSDEQSELNFNYIQSHDQIKNNYCKSHNINLLRIKYDENTEEKLTKWFQNHKLYEN